MRPMVSGNVIAMQTLCTNTLPINDEGSSGNLQLKLITHSHSTVPSFHTKALTQLTVKTC